MRTTQLIRFVLSTWKPSIYRITPGVVVAVLLITVILFAQPPDAADLKVMKTGLGSGTVVSDTLTINCGSDCDESYASSVSVTLTATADSGSTFLGWSGDCAGTGPCVVTMSASRSVRAVFDVTPTIPPIPSSCFTPEGLAGIADYLAVNSTVNSAARFIKALPSEYKQNWILMSRSESLQTGTAESPRLLLPSANAQNVFTVGMTEHSSYPGSHRNAIELMQWDGVQKNFRFHEIVVADIPGMDPITLPDGSTGPRFPARGRGVSIDDSKCSKCHSTQNVLNLDRSVSPPVPGSSRGTDGVPPGTLKVKNKPNWDAYDSWGGMMPFNRDRIYQGSVEAAAFRKTLNLWTWRTNDSVRSIIEQLELQPPGVLAQDAITRTNGGTHDGHINFAFDTSPPVLTEPAPSGDSTTAVNYSFDRVMGTGAGTSVTRGGAFITVHHSDIPTIDEGRGVRLFDALGGLAGTLNQQRIADELVSHRFATGSVPIDIRPIALAITKGCINITAGTVTGTSPLTIDLGFLNARNGMSIADLVADTRSRAQSLPRRKADMQKLDLDRTGDTYLRTSAPANGLIQQYGAATSAGTDTSIGRLRQEVFRRPIDLGFPDSVIGGFYVDRESYDFNTELVALYRYFLEPLGVSVDKWSMGVRGRSRTYTFADVFSTYRPFIEPELKTSLRSNPVPGLSNLDDCAQLIAAVNSTLSSLPPADARPTYTDIQRIFNKSCIECHGGLGYPPYRNYGNSLDLSENESPAPGVSRLLRSHDIVEPRAMSRTGPLFRRIFIDTSEDCPFGLMPCGGPSLSRVDIETIGRWIDGGHGFTEGDPHIKTIDGVNYDFQGVGEFVLLRGETLEIQARQTALGTGTPLGPNPHTGLTSCVSLNTAVAVRVGGHRITYQPNINGEPDPTGLQLRIDGELTKMDAREILLASGGRIIRTTDPESIQIESPGGTVVVITTAWWDHYQLWYMNINVHRARETEGLMGAIPPGNWLPALPDGSFMGPRPADPHQRYKDLYGKFANAWRVNDATTLFDYAPGISAKTFSIDGWPAEFPESCSQPQQLGGPAAAKSPLKALLLEEAQQHCRDIVDDDRRANCVQDVMVTGEAGFAKSYLLTQQLERKAIPTAPLLVFPEDNKTDLPQRVSFTWDKTSDSDGAHLTYRHCVWGVDERYTLNNCDAVSIQTTSWSRGIVYAVPVALVGCVLFAVLIIKGMRRNRRLLGTVAIAIVAAVILAFYVGGATSSKTTSKTVSGLESGKSYFWKVIAEDDKGGSTESETWRFTIK